MKVTGLLLAGAATAALAAGCADDDGPAQDPTQAPARTGGADGDAGAATHGATPPQSPHGHGSAQGQIAVTVEGGVADFGAFRAQVPEAWAYREPDSQMRVAEFSLPAEGGGEPAELVVFYFGEDGAGDVQANIDRWASGFDTDEEPEIETREVSGMAVTTVDLSGHYVAPVRPGAPETHDEPDYRMFGAIVETESGPFYFRALGPGDTVAAHVDGALSFLESIE